MLQMAQPVLGRLPLVFEVKKQTKKQHVENNFQKDHQNNRCPCYRVKKSDYEP